MSQSAPQDNGPRRVTPPPSANDLDALLQALQADARAPNGGAQQPSAGTVERPAGGDPMARRVQALIRAFDVLHKQVGAIAAQGETISKVAESQARDAKTLAELQRNVRYLRAIVIQQLQQAGSNSGGTLPQLQIKLVVGHLVEQYQQAEREAAVLAQWAMLFVGLAVGMGIAAVMSVINRAGPALWIFATVALVTLVVALIFAALARSARTRAAAARRSMDESTLLRTVATNPVGEAG